ncbi:hypothetical protein [Streptomyces sp. NPDC014734]|uniref:hypothetical protein n=1 Tax=Streptomyces sp. NPDC014734 TaxID=3364886 RepID=UPI0036F850E6
MNVSDPHDDGSVPTRTEDLLVRALAARAEQITGHSLRPGEPPPAARAGRGRGRLVLALAAGVTVVALVGGVTTTLADRDGRSDDTASPTAGASAPPPPDGDVPGTSRLVRVAYGPQDTRFTLRTGGTRRVFDAMVTNNIGRTVFARDVLTITPEGGGLRTGDISLSVYRAGAWQPIGRTDGTVYTAELARGSLADGAERHHRFRLGLNSAFPSDVGVLRVSFMSNGGREALAPSR